MTASIAPAATQLVESLARLREALLSTSVTVRDDRPDGELAVGSHLHDALQDLAGWVQQAFTDAIDATRPDASPAEVRASLAACEDNLWSATRAVFGELGSEALRGDLLRLVASAPLWSEWVRALLHGLDACRAPMLDANEALMAAWRAVREEPAITDRAS